MITFQVEKKDTKTKARVGKIFYNGKEYETPMFMPVGTQATVKTLSPEEVKETKAGVILANTYHLWLRPGDDIVKEAGGLHKFMNYDGPILTDSGGFQVFSLAKNKKKDITEEGVHFKSHIDGKNLFLTPELSIEIQNKLDSDIAMSFDECIPYPASYEYAKESTERTLRWAKRGKDVFNNENQSLFGIVQGGEYQDLREYSAKKTVEIGFDGYSIGGTSVGEDKKTMYKMIDDAIPETTLINSKTDYFINFDILIGDNNERGELSIYYNGSPAEILIIVKSQSYLDIAYYVAPKN